MIPLETYQRILAWLYAFPSDDSATKRKKVLCLLISLSVIVANFLGIVAGAFFISKYMSTNLAEAIYALFHTIAACSMLYQSITAVLMRNKLSATFKSLEKIYHENENEDSYPLLVHTNQKCERIWTYFVKYVLIACAIIVLTTSIISVTYSFIMDGYFNIDRAYVPLNYILPWNQSTLLGYSLEVCFTIATGEAYLITNGSIMILFISMSLHHQTFYKMFRNEAAKLDYHIRTRNEADHLRKLICFHISVKNWFLKTAEALSPFISVVLISSMLISSSAVFNLKMQMKHPDFGMVTCILAISCAISNLFVYCYFGKLATESHKKMSDSLYECNWQDLSPEHQKYFIVMIQNTQKPLYYHGFGVFMLDLETFTTMVHAIYNYYTIFMTLTTN